MILASVEEELTKLKRARALAQAEIEANEEDYGTASEARDAFFDLRDEVLRESITDLDKQIAALEEKVRWERSLPR